MRKQKEYNMNVRYLLSFKEKGLFKEFCAKNSKKIKGSIGISLTESGIKKPARQFPDSAGLSFICNEY